MEKLSLDDLDYELIKHAHRVFETVDSDWHGVSSALQLQSGKIFTGVVLEAEVPALTVCAEPFAIEKALPHIKNDPIVSIVATRFREETDHKVIPPCGRCREFITDYAPDAGVIIYDDKEEKLYKIKAIDLLPFKYKSIP